MAWTTLVLSEGPMAVCVCMCVMDEGPYFSSQTRPDGWELRLVSFTPRSRHLGTRQMTFRPGTGQLGFCFCKKHHDQKINVKQLCKLSDVIVLPREKPSYNLRKITTYFQHNLHYAAVICFFSLSLSLFDTGLVGEVSFQAVKSCSVPKTKNPLSYRRKLTFRHEVIVLCRRGREEDLRWRQDGWRKEVGREREKDRTRKRRGEWVHSITAWQHNHRHPNTNTHTRMQNYAKS